LFSRKTLLSSALSAALLFVAAGAAGAADTIGVLESQKILYQHPNFGLVARQVGERGRAKEAEIQAALERTSDPGERARIIAEGSREMKSEETRLMAPINRECQNAVASVAKTKKMTVVMEKTATYYGGTDITEDVIRYLKTTVKKIEPPQAAR
jgi:outer membrane protein